ncbi:BON domain-containing protein [Rhizobium sp. EC-SD404]|uniref:BON domain-containing protein n=1 Tax=Rhizobium sp. EC-SD404 TaxID=2038389 RepID=UPI00125A3904|nr:BON domain-containing protein [Rhizobium sp. EC-SD404]VVS96545.1 Ornithine aminotransferase [Rhizobium sp. EC-SD404]
MLDKTLRQTIIDALDFDPGLHSADIGVAVENGVVTLTGHVPTYDEKLTAEDLVKRIKGVRGIAQEIEVRPAGTHRTADDEIAKRALNVIRWNTTVPDDQIQVKVQRGWVTLTGRVEWQYQKNAAAGAVRGLVGVIGVSNMIEIRPRAEATDIKKRIEAAFKRDAELEAQSIQVDVHDGRVTLEGHVKVWADRQAAERAAWSAPGVTAVEDRITLA